jgi:RNA-directed DNA polymerase
MILLDLLSKRLPLSKGELQLLIVTAPNRYKVHTIDKRHNRGKRLIAQPAAEVKMAQAIAQKSLIGRLPVHECAKAYRTQTSIKDHASPHAPNRYLLKVDFKDFFPSIMGGDFCAHLDRHLQVEKQEAEFFSHLFFWRPKKTNQLLLAIGAPSSPWLSNTILFEFDTRLSEYCKSKQIVYTRYADDLALSTNLPNILGDALAEIRSICLDLKYPRLTINEDKTVFTSKKHNRTLTGLVLANDGKTSIGRDKKREIRALAKNYERGNIDAEKSAYLSGILAFTLSIDADFNKSIARMIGVEKYSQLIKH